MPNFSRMLAVSAALLLAAGQAQASDSESCTKVKLADIGWTDIQATTGVTTVVLEALGYQPTSTLRSIPITFAAMKDGEIDAFLGDWQPSLGADRQPYLDDGSVTVLGVNLEGAKYTLAVPTYLAEQGLRDFSDIARFKDALNGKIYGIEAGNDGNRIIQSLIDDDAFGLGSFSLVESSEQGMLAQFDRHYGQQEAAVILAWAPHPMNARFDITYLSGGDDWFGPDFGSATVHTNVRSGLVDECPNLARFLGQLRFSLELENDIMGAILDRDEDPVVAARAWLSANPDAVRPWLDGVVSRDGQADADLVIQAIVQ